MTTKDDETRSKILCWKEKKSQAVEVAEDALKDVKTLPKNIPEVNAITIEVLEALASQSLLTSTEGTEPPDSRADSESPTMRQ